MLRQAQGVCDEPVKSLSTWHRVCMSLMYVGWPSLTQGYFRSAWCLVRCSTLNPAEQKGTPLLITNLQVHTPMTHTHT